MESEAYRDWINTRRLDIVSKANARYERYEKSKYGRKKKKLRKPLEIGEDVLLLSSRIKKKNDPRKFYKSRIGNRPFFEKSTIFTITNRQNIDNKTFYWLKSKKTNKKSSFASYDKRFMRYWVIFHKTIFDQKKFSIKKNIISKIKMDIIYKKVTNFDKGNNFSIDLWSNNQIQSMFFKGKDEWIVSGLDLNVQTIEKTAEYTAL